MMTIYCKEKQRGNDQQKAHEGQNWENKERAEKKDRTMLHEHQEEKTSNFHTTTYDLRSLSYQAYRPHC